MNPNGHKSARERLVHTLERAGGQLSFRELIFDYGFRWAQIDDLLEIAGSPIAVRLHQNGHPKPATLVVLKQYTPPKPVSQQEAVSRLNAMSSEQFYAMIDPTFKLRHKRRAGGGARTSTSADEYPGTDSDSAL
jgi:hypothetical protein